MTKPCEPARRLHRGILRLVVAIALVPAVAGGAPTLIAVTPTSVDVGSLGYGDNASVNFAITNIADGDIWLTWNYRGSSLMHTDCQESAINMRDPPILHPGETCTQAIGINAAIGILQGATGPTQTLVDFSANSGAQVVTATVAWNALVPRISISPSPIIMGPVPVGTSAAQDVVLTNNSEVTTSIHVNFDAEELTDCDALSIAAIGPHGPGPSICTTLDQQRKPSMFVGLNGCVSVAPHASCHAYLTYKPNVALPTEAFLEVYDDTGFSIRYPVIARAEPVQLVAGTVLAIEYFTRIPFHFFVTAIPGEIAALDAGDFAGWSRTGRSFWVYPPGASIAPGDSPVCRYFSTPAAGFSSHFYSAFPQECDAIPTLFPDIWTLETMDAFGVQQPDTTTGACPNGTSPLYRLYNGGPNVNHRYVADANARELMRELGWIPEGYGPLGVGMCLPQ